MRLYELLQAYDFDEIMPVIVDMFPGTGKYRGQLREAWDTLLGMRPVPSKKEIKYKFIKGANDDEQYVGADDRDFDTTWEVIIGKNVSREKGVDLNDAEMLANCLVNICLIGKHPRSFENSYMILSTPDR
uniref:hypothetical protein n=1 Tax=Prevotella sp. TaxID=59823 RepID=UPI003FEDBAA3